MDERSQHGYHQHSQPEPQTAAAAPWPTYAAPQQGAPIHGHAPYPGPAPHQPHYAPMPQSHAHAQHQQQHAQQQHAPAPQQLPSMHQFQYAANGYVLPGAAPAQGAPMSAHGGTIGMPQTAQQMHAPYVAQHAAPAQYEPAQHAVMGGGAPAPLHTHAPAHAQPQAWAFPTPHGMQLVQPGAVATHVPHHAGMSASPIVRRMRWETIVPILAVLCLIGAIALFMHDFDRITGRDAATATATSSRMVDSSTDEDSSTDAKVEGGGAATKPADEPSTPMATEKAAASPRELALHKRLGIERREQRWTAVIATIGQLEQIRPLDRQLLSLRTRARAAAKASARRAAAAKAAAAKRAATPSNPGAGGGGHAGHDMPPAAGGNKGASTGARPPADVPKGSIPAVPNVPNPSAGGATGGAAAVGGGMPAAGSGDNCHAHDGVTSCHD